MEDAQIAIGGSASFSVQVKGFPPPQIEWRLNNKVVSDGDKGVTVEEEEDGCHQIKAWF